MLRHVTLLLGVAAFLAIAADTALAVAYRPYYITDLGTVDGNPPAYFSKALGINESGVVVGQSAYNNEPQITHAFVWSNGTMTDLNGSYDESQAWDVNDDGIVLGRGFRSDLVPGYTIPELWTYDMKTGVRTVLSTGIPYKHIITSAINNDGVIAGAGEYTRYQAFYHLGGTADTCVELPASEGFSEGTSQATDINNNGIMIGSGKIGEGGGNWIPFVYNIDTEEGTLLDEIVAGETATQVWAINDNGLILGQGSMGHFVYDLYGGTTTMLPAIDHLGLTCDINNHGQVLGWDGGDPEHPDDPPLGNLLYDMETGVLTKLRDLIPSDQLINPGPGTCINDAGWIAGSWIAKDEFGEPEPYCRPYVMRPALFGDANIDGSVNGTDLNTVLSNYNATITGDNKTRWLAGDFNCDGSVNGSDLNTVLSNYNQSVSLSSTAAVPEPSTVLLALAALLSLVAWRKRMISTRRVV